MSSLTTSRVREAFAGDYAFGTLNGYLAQEELRAEVIAKINERFAHTAAALPVYENTGAVICASNPYIITAYNTVGAECGTRTILPHELEQVIAAGKWKEECYVDLGVVLDFSGYDHVLALDVWEQLPRNKKDFDALPFLITTLGLAKADARQGFPEGLRFLLREQTHVLSASVLAGSSGYFEADDDVLVKTGLPSRVFSKNFALTDRYIFNSRQHERSLEHLGISRLSLYQNLGINSGYIVLAGSNMYGRVVPVDGAEGAQSISAPRGTGQKRTLLPSQWLSADGKSTEIEVGEDTGQNFIAEGDLAKVLSEIEQGGKLAPEIRELILHRVKQQEDGK